MFWHMYGWNDVWDFLQNNTGSRGKVQSKIGHNLVIVAGDGLRFIVLLCLPLYILVICHNRKRNTNDIKVGCPETNVVGESYTHCAGEAPPLSALRSPANCSSRCPVYSLSRLSHFLSGIHWLWTPEVALSVLLSPQEIPTASSFRAATERLPPHPWGIWSRPASHTPAPHPRQGARPRCQGDALEETCSRTVSGVSGSGTRGGGWTSWPRGAAEAAWTLVGVQQQVRLSWGLRRVPA